MEIVLLIIFLLSFIGSFIFAGFETGFISWNTLKIEHRAKQGGPRSKMAMVLQNNSAMLITTVLVGNNIALVGMSLSLEKLLVNIPLLGNELFQNAFLTVIALVFCELLPKSLFRIYSFRLTMYFVPLVTVLFFVFSPLSKLISLLTGGGGDEVSGRKEAIAAIAMEGGRHKLFSTIYGEVVDEVIRCEKKSLASLCGKLTPVARCTEEFLAKSPVADVWECFSQSAPFSAIDPIAYLLGDKRFLSQPYFYIKEAGTITCYLQQEAIEKLFLFTDKD